VFDDPTPMSYSSSKDYSWNEKPWRDQEDRTARFLHQPGQPLTRLTSSRRELMGALPSWDSKSGFPNSCGGCIPATCSWLTSPHVVTVHGQSLYGPWQLPGRSGLVSVDSIAACLLRQTGELGGLRSGSLMKEGVRATDLNHISGEVIYHCVGPILRSPVHLPRECQLARSSLQIVRSSHARPPYPGDPIRSSSSLEGARWECRIT
jgi:hypothetical protein